MHSQPSVSHRGEGAFGPSVQLSSVPTVDANVFASDVVTDSNVNIENRGAQQRATSLPLLPGPTPAGLPLTTISLPWPNDLSSRHGSGAMLRTGTVIRSDDAETSAPPQHPGNRGR